MTIAKPYFQIIDNLLFRQVVIISINQTDDELLQTIYEDKSLWPPGVKRRIDSIKYILDPFADVNSTVLGRTVRYDSGIILVRLYNVESIYKPSTLGILTHELLHAVIYTMENKSIKLSHESEEVFTYTLDFMMTEFFTSYQKVNK
jgi:hypothetical protein